MALIYIYDSTELDKQQISDGLRDTDHTWHFVDETISRDNLNPETEVISVFVSSNVTTEIIEALPRLRLIACRSTGYNNIDMAAAEERGITVVNVPTYGESTVAEYAFSLLLTLTRKLTKTLESFDEEIDAQQIMGTDLNGKCMGIIGAGRIGQHAIRIAKGFGMEVLAYDPFPKPELAEELGFTFVELDDLLRRSDFVSLHAPYVGTNKHIINAENIRFMRSTAILINTARGELVDTRALTEALQEHRIAGAGLDVLEGEQLMHVNEEVMLLRSERKPLELMEHSVELLVLHKMPNVIVTPHNAFNTIEAVHRINTTTTDNMKNFWYNDVPNKVKAPAKVRGKLLLVRHTESVWNAQGKWTGVTDVSLNENGFMEAGKLGQLLQSMDIHIDQAFCSEQVRTLETLRGILDTSQQLDVPITRSSAINERDYGEYTGKNKWEVRELIGEEKFDAVRRGWDEPVPGGETLRTVYERVTPFYQQQIVPLLNAGKNVLIVAHGNSIRALMKYIENLDEKAVNKLEMLFGTIVTYEVDELGHMLKRSDKAIEIEPPNA